MNPGKHISSEVTVLIPHYQTLDLIRLCLRSIRKHTQFPCKVVVLDNGSKDESIAYLKSLKWIDLVETGVANKIWDAHYESLNMGISRVETPYFLIMHSDTFVHNDLWLDFLIEEINKGYAAVGPRHQRVPVRRFFWLFMAMFRNLRVRYGNMNVPIVRSFCALYKTDIFQQNQCKFVYRNETDINYSANETLVKNGHRIYGLPASRLSGYIFHASAMTIINTVHRAGETDSSVTALKGESYVDAKTRRRSSLAFDKFINLPATQAIISDSSLDT